MKKSRKWLISGLFDDFAKCPRCGERWPIDSVIGWNWCPKCRQPVNGFGSDTISQPIRNGEPTLASVLRLWNIDDDELVVLCPIDEKYQPFHDDHLCAYTMSVKGIRKSLDLQRITVSVARQRSVGFLDPTYELVLYVRNANLRELYVRKSDDFIMMMESVPKPKRRGKKK